MDTTPERSVGTGRPDEGPGWRFRDGIPFTLNFADGIPRIFRYLSKRLLTEEYLQLTAFERGVFGVTKVESRFPGLGITAEKRDDPENPYWLAKVVAQSRRPHVVRIDNCAPGDHTMFRMPARFGELRVLEQRARVAWFTGLAGPLESRTLVALCGSLSNLLGYCPPEGKQFVGWYPSAASGLDAFLRDAAGVESPIESYRWEDAVASRARLVNGIYLGRDSPEYAVSAEIDVLAQVHEVLSRAEIGPAWPNSEYDRIVLGAPLIVADAPARTRRERERDKSLRLRLAEKLAGRPLPPT